MAGEIAMALSPGNSSNRPWGWFGESRFRLVLAPIERGRSASVTCDMLLGVPMSRSVGFCRLMRLADLKTANRLQTNVLA
jgi:hypothetical protein